MAMAMAAQADNGRADAMRKLETMKIRHHGDFHLGQMLIVKDDVKIIDFEGEPARELQCRPSAVRPGVIG